MFRSADGILGLAYAPLDDAFTMPQNTWTRSIAHEILLQIKHLSGRGCSGKLSNSNEPGMS
jgi:hypothetical protein